MYIAKALQVVVIKCHLKIHKVCSYLVLSILLWLTLCLPAQALILEDLIASGTIKSTLTNKRIGYYIGSFDPLHKGHEDVVNLVLAQKLCDYVFIYPNFGGDSFKNRINVNLRSDMIFSVFSNHPRVIVTRLNPSNMQNHLTIADKQHNLGNTQHSYVKSAFAKTNFIGIIGADTAFYFHRHPESMRSFMVGRKIPAEYAEHTLGGLMALPVNTFIVAARSGYNLAELNGKIVDRQIIATITSKTELTTSSTKIKTNLRANKSISTLVNPAVAKILAAKNLYR